MPNVPIVTEVTKAELDALVAANGLNEGLQYKVTDKGWLLVATSNNTLKAASGTINTINELLPTYIDADIVIIDTGVITDALSLFEIKRRNDFVFSSMFIDNQGGAFDLLTLVDAQNEFDLCAIQPLDSACKYFTSASGILLTNGQAVDTSKKIYEGFYFLNSDPIGNKTIRAKIELKRMLF